MNLPDDPRHWWYYPIEMPITQDGYGPATVGVDADKVVYEVWDQILVSHGSFDHLPDAIAYAIKKNREDCELYKHYLIPKDNPPNMEF